MAARLESPMIGLILGYVFGGAPFPTTVANPLKCIPTPTSVARLGGAIPMKGIDIVSTNRKLDGIANVLAGDLSAVTDQVITVKTKPITRAIVLRLTPDGPKESYTIEAKSNITVTAKTPQGISHAAATLLQLIEKSNGKCRIPRFVLNDTPKSSYRGMMIDVARRYHSIDVLKQCVVLCHLYKLNYLQLHLSDDQAFTFPSTAFPKISTQNQHGGPAYTLTQLKDLVRFADDHGVTVVPEMDIPGHSGMLNRTMPDLFKIKGTKPYEHHATINFVNPAVLQAVDKLIGEMCDVFHSSPYFHMGGDEADISLVDQHPDFQSAFSKLGLPPHSQQELFRRFIGQVNDIVKKKGKKLIVWEGFGRDMTSKFPISKDILVMEFENSYYLPQELVADGYSLVNASWTPLYVVNRHVWPARKVFDWNLNTFGRFSNLYATTTWMQSKSTSHIEGSQLCSWEGPEELEIQNLRRLSAAMSERSWSSSSGTYAEFESKLGATDSLLTKLIQTVEIVSSTLDAKDPNGYDVPCFTRPLTIKLSGRDGCQVRYTLDGKPPTDKSPQFTKPFLLNQTTTIRAALYGAAGRIGFESSAAYYYVPPHVPNLATGKHVIVSGGTQSPQNPELVVDDNLDLNSSWWATPAPQWLQVDLGKTLPIGRVEVFPYWDGRRYYQYLVEISVDGKTWKQVADRSQNTTPASSQGDEIKFAPTSARYVRVTLLKGSANEAVHLVELRVWGATQ